MYNYKLFAIIYFYGFYFIFSKDSIYRCTSKLFGMTEKKEGVIISSAKVMKVNGNRQETGSGEDKSNCNYFHHLRKLIALIYIK